jgi:hypothetical protein
MPGLRHCGRKSQALSIKRAAPTEHGAATLIHRQWCLYWQDEQLDRRCPDESIAAPFLRRLSEAPRDITE